MAQCYKPFFVKNEKGQQVLIPCGKCPKCKARRVSAWSFRLMQEDKKSTSSYFITLTYNNENLPITANGYHSLSKHDLQCFFKRLRRAQRKVAGGQKKPVKYFAVGEYGGKIGRPHYHIILFNADIRTIQNAWSSYRWDCCIGKVERRGEARIYHRERFKEVRHHLGAVHYGDDRGVSGASVGYTLKYILKPKDNGGCPDDDSQPEFTCMSKGLGIGYINDASVKWHRAALTDRMYVNPEGTRHKVSMPRYYKDKIYTKQEREDIANSSRDKFAEKILEDLFREFVMSENYVEAYQKRKRGFEESSNAAYRKQKLLTKKRKVYATA